MSSGYFKRFLHKFQNHSKPELEGWVHVAWISQEYDLININVITFVYALRLSNPHYSCSRLPQRKCHTSIPLGEHNWVRQIGSLNRSSFNTYMYINIYQINILLITLIRKKYPRNVIKKWCHLYTKKIQSPINVVCEACVAL